MSRLRSLHDGFGGAVGLGRASAGVLAGALATTFSVARISASITLAIERSAHLACNKARVAGMSPARRSVMVAIIGGMMAAAYLDSQGIVDLSYGFPRRGFAEGALMAITGATAGYAVLLAFRKLRDFVTRDRR